jgi:uncharacterized membrane protein SpoIIM required for sporulation
MKVVDLLAARSSQWSELDALCGKIETTSGRRLPLLESLRFASLYRAACADLALADAYQLPPSVVQHLHQLVGRAHNQLYRSRTFQWSAWMHEAFVAVPQRLFHDNALRLAFCVFWGMFLAAGLSAYASPSFAEQLLGRDQLNEYEKMYEDVPNGRSANMSGQMAGFYVRHNAGIGLQCFAAGLIFGVGGLLITLSNGAVLGAVFGYMATTPQSDNFYHFVTAHGPFELTAVVLASAAGMHMGFALVDPQGWTRYEAMRRAAREAVPTVILSVTLFILAAGIEAFVSPSSLPYAVKALVAVVSSSLLMAYFVLLGMPHAEVDDAAR